MYRDVGVRGDNRCTCMNIVQSCARRWKGEGGNDNSDMNNCCVQDNNCVNNRRAARVTQRDTTQPSTGQLRPPTTHRHVVRPSRECTLYRQPSISWLFPTLALITEHTRPTTDMADTHHFKQNGLRSVRERQTSQAHNQVITIGNRVIPVQLHQ
ncbi:hypothetical protein Bbelb_059630 [Branchiostoma belcheri]|nr:hypothetical protein Bbelb_059630 [Branchiostoma belcheri]